MPFGVEFHDAAVPRSGRIFTGVTEGLDYTNIVFHFFQYRMHQR